MEITFDSLVLPAGIAAAAAAITTIVQLLSNVFPGLGARFSGALQAFVLAAVLYAAALVAGVAPTPDGLLQLVIAWSLCATAAVGIHGTVRKAAEATGMTAETVRVPAKPKPRRRIVHD